MTRTRNNNLSLSNVYEDKAKYVHKMGGGGVWVKVAEKLSVYRQ